MSSSLNSLEGVIKGILGVQTIDHISTAVVSIINVLAKVSLTSNLGKFP